MRTQIVVSVFLFTHHLKILSANLYAYRIPFINNNMLCSTSQDLLSRLRNKIGCTLALQEVFNNKDIELTSHTEIKSTK